MTARFIPRWGFPGVLHRNRQRGRNRFRAVGGQA